MRSESPVEVPCARPVNPVPEIEPGPLANPARRRTLVVGSSAAFLAACGGGGTGTDSAGSGVDTGVDEPQALPAAPPTSRADASRFLQQASFGPTTADVSSLMGSSYAGWIDQQLALQHSTLYTDAMQAWFDRGDAYRPGEGGERYTPGIVEEAFWKNSITAPGQLRARMLHSLVQIFVVSQSDSNLYDHGRAFGGYLDNLSRLAFGNFRDLLEMVALSPVMGIYLSHIRNQKADAASGRQPDENFAREVMQLFSIGLHQLNDDGTQKTGNDGQPIETYNNKDVIGLARVFTGWSWDMPDSDSWGSTFRWGGPDRYETTGNARFDLRPMRIYPDFHAPEKKQFLGVTIAAGTAGPKSLKIALDTLFNHPNVGPFIGRQLIQRLVTSNPSPAYVQRVARAFANNGQGVRGDLKAVLRTILLDAEARGTPGVDAGRLRDPVQRTAHWARSLGARSLTGRWMMGWDLRVLSQQALNSPSVFNFYRPGYVPPNSGVADKSLVAPELQIANESTLAEWVNYSDQLSGWGTGWTGEGPELPASQRNQSDVRLDFSAAGSVIRSLIDGGIENMLDQLDLLLFAGRMDKATRAALLAAVNDVRDWGTADERAERRVRLAVFLSLASPDYLVQQ